VSTLKVTHQTTPGQAVELNLESPRGRNSASSASPTGSPRKAYRAISERRRALMVWQVAQRMPCRKGFPGQVRPLNDKETESMPVSATEDMLGHLSDRLKVQNKLGLS